MRSEELHKRPSENTRGRREHQGDLGRPQGEKRVFRLLALFLPWRFFTGIPAAFACAVLLFLGSGCASQKPYQGYKHSPYTIRGVRYEPMSPREAVGFVEMGVASHYKGGSFFRHGITAIGERLSPRTCAAAHKTLPLPCVVRVTNLRNGRSMVVRVNDRGPFIQGRILDVTRPVAQRLGFYQQGLTPVRIEVLSVGDGKYRIRN